MIVSVKLMDAKTRDILVEFLVKKKKVTIWTVKEFLKQIALPSKKMDDEKKDLIAKSIEALIEMDESGRSGNLEFLIRKTDLIVGNMKARIILKSVVVYDLDRNREIIK